jgi:predicted nucleic acid-binding protein
MIFVDSSVWIDYFNGQPTEAANFLDGSLGVENLVIGDIVLTEVLQGFKRDKDFDTAKNLLTSFEVHPIVNQELAIKSADNFRLLRKRGVTVRKTIDVIIATYCIENQITLLQSDKDFVPFSEHLGLRLLPDSL